MSYDNFVGSLPALPYLRNNSYPMPNNFHPIQPQYFASNGNSSSVSHMNAGSDLQTLVANYSLVQRTEIPKLNVSTIALLMSNYKRLLVRVERIFKYLEVTKKTLSEEDWSAKCEELEANKALLLEIDEQLSDPQFRKLAVKTVERVRSKRERMKRKKLEWREKRKDIKDIREQKHKKIDLWLEKMQDEVERARRAEAVKKEADLVLSGVTHKKSEAKRVLGLLNSLTKLRNAKVLQLASTTRTVSQEETNSFTLVVDKLKTMWAKQLKEYNMEEHGLKVMLNDAEVERMNTEEKIWRKNLHLWTETFFGERNFVSSLQPSDTNQLQAIRNTWDQFAAAEDIVLSSCIPNGWVVPVEPSDAEWAKLIVEP